jgi:hypothetical protein
MAEEWRRWLGSPSDFQQMREAIKSIFDEAPDALVHTRAVPARPTPAPARKTRPGRRPIHDWPLIERLDAEFCRTYCAETRRPPSWKERHAALAKKLGMDTLHLKTLQRRLPKIAILKERNSRSI